jgi:hypothetical protein
MTNNVCAQCRRLFRHGEIPRAVHLTLSDGTKLTLPGNYHQRCAKAAAMSYKPGEPPRACSHCHQPFDEGAPRMAAVYQSPAGDVTVPGDYHPACATPAAMADALRLAAK